MNEADDRTERKRLFIIRNGRKVAKYEDGQWVPLLPGVVVRNTTDGIRLKCRIKLSAIAVASKRWQPFYDGNISPLS